MGGTDSGLVGFFFSSRRRHTRFDCDWSSDVCSSDLFVDGANIGMIESRRRARLPAKAFQGLRISRKMIGKEFEGHETPQLGILSLINHTHPAATELLQNAVVRDGLTDHGLGNAMAEAWASQ